MLLTGFKQVGEGNRYCGGRLSPNLANDVIFFFVTVGIGQRYTHQSWTLGYESVRSAISVSTFS